jgi:hypothetical protein
MRPPILCVTIAAFVTGCSSGGSTGGSVELSFGDAGPDAITFTTTPAGAAAITGEFSTTGDFEGQYTLSTTIPMGTPIASCLLSVDGATPTTSTLVDDSTGQTHTLTVQIGLASGYAGQAVCNVNASNAAKPGIGDSVAIVVAGSSADGG